MAINFLVVILLKKNTITSKTLKNIQLIKLILTYNKCYTLIISI